ncbi:MAG: T9SS type A sorting domain-containing protein [Candidatus Kryptoniota bacterium]
MNKILLILVSFIGLCEMTEAQTNSFHFTRGGKYLWYSGTNGGAESIFGVAWNQLTCTRCHGDSLATGVAVVDSTYKPGCNDCHASDFSVNSPKTCLKCHSRQGAVITISKIDTNYTDVHVAAGLTCKTCHTKNDVHADASSYKAMWDQFNDPNSQSPRCEKCHTSVPNTTSHTVHNGTLDCAACHQYASITCYNCHFETELATDGRIKRAYAQFRDFILLGKLPNGKIYPGTFMSLTYQGKSFVVAAPFYSHTIRKRGRACTDCHNNSIVQQYNNNHFVPIIKWDSTQSKLFNTKGVIPLAPDWKDAFGFDFLNYTGKPDSATNPTKWVFLKSGANGEQIIPSYFQPLTAQEMAKISTIVHVDTEPKSIPGNFQLYQNYPNPFNPTTFISFNLKVPTTVTLKVYDILGTEVKSLLQNKPITPGIHSIRFDAQGLRSGVYICKIVTPEFTASKKMILIK